MRRFIALASILAVVLVAVVATRGELTTAQEATSDVTVAMATHPIVGTWRFVSDFGEGPTINYATFHADGTYFHEGFAGGPLSFGAWEPTSERTVDLRYHQLYVWEDRVAEAEARFAFEVDETGNTLDGQGVYVARYVDDGTIDYTYETTRPGTRITAAPLVALETLIAETEISASPVP